MSLTNTNSRVGPYTLSTLPQVLAVSFPFQAAADLKVYNIGTASVPLPHAVLLTLNSDYTVTGGGYNVANSMQTGSVTVAAGGAGSLAVGDKIVILRMASENQLTSFLSSGLLTVPMIEQALDKQATLIQDLQNQVRSALRIPITDDPNLSEMIRDERANMLLSFDSDGNFAYILLQTAVDAAVAAGTALALAAAAAAAASAGDAAASALDAAAQVALAAAQVALAAAQVALAEAAAAAAAASAAAAAASALEAAASAERARLYAEPAIYDLGDISGSVQVDYSNSMLQAGHVVGALTLMPPLHGVAGLRVEIWLTPTGGDRTLNFDASIKKPSDSTSTWPKTMTSGLLYIVQLKYDGAAWMLSTVVGGF